VVVALLGLGVREYSWPLMSGEATFKLWYQSVS
jgi:hypothetical protein